jgi:hypothetical protein
MENLAPFVASVLRDGVAADLMQENSKVRQVMDQQGQDLLLQRSTFAITGQGGSPIFVAYQADEYQAHEWLRQGDADMSVLFTKSNTSTQPCTLVDLRQCEVYRHGLRMGRLLQHDGDLHLVSILDARAGSIPVTRLDTATMMGADFCCTLDYRVRFTVYLDKSQRLDAEAFEALLRTTTEDDSTAYTHKCIPMESLGTVLGNEQRVLFASVNGRVNATAA